MTMEEFAALENFIECKIRDMLKGSAISRAYVESNELAEAREEIFRIFKME